RPEVLDVVRAVAPDDRGVLARDVPVLDGEIRGLRAAADDELVLFDRDALAVEDEVERRARARLRRDFRRRRGPGRRRGRPARHGGGAARRRGRLGGAGAEPRSGVPRGRSARRPGRRRRRRPPEARRARRRGLGPGRRPLRRIGRRRVRPASRRRSDLAALRGLIVLGPRVVPHRLIDEVVDGAIEVVRHLLERLPQDVAAVEVAHRLLALIHREASSFVSSSAVSPAVPRPPWLPGPPSSRTRGPSSRRPRARAVARRPSPYLLSPAPQSLSAAPPSSEIRGVVVRGARRPDRTRLSYPRNNARSQPDPAPGPAGAHRRSGRSRRALHNRARGMRPSILGWAARASLAPRMVSGSYLFRSPRSARTRG